ncbi:hypothetical protein D554_2175 [Bordetella holmesii 30539]|uniref:N-acetyltransferase YedL n=1 Tax=Bordetella holmesii 1058 TaxID=1247648 RepID=A0ABN0S0G9_9BORD|nr:hypothetical protein D560_0528 [Bordetella holmesii ATCC 51541]EWM49901.1 hypothetical protein D555_0529 [Bordetella holmesii 35009]EXF86922.1 hypothetical protein D554_2175 [Bordetella holmesii 30539]EXX95053.1 hypothetical protein D559_2480 [Bordetella holmesii 1058]
MPATINVAVAAFTHSIPVEELRSFMAVRVLLKSPQYAEAASSDMPEIRLF